MLSRKSHFPADNFVTVYLRPTVRETTPRDHRTKNKKKKTINKKIVSFHSFVDRSSLFASAGALVDDDDVLRLAANRTLDAVHTARSRYCYSIASRKRIIIFARQRHNYYYIVRASFRKRNTSKIRLDDVKLLSLQ